MAKRSTLRNKFERKIDGQLSKLYGSAYSYEQERILYTTTSWYIPDFVISLPSGDRYIECKGYLRVADKRKLTTVKKQYPGLDLRIVFYRMPLLPIQKWCKKLGIPWAVSDIPQVWFEDVQPDAKRPKQKKHKGQLTFFRLLKNDKNKTPKQ